MDFDGNLCYYAFRNGSLCMYRSTGGKKASVDGSVMISYAADSHTLYGELYRWPAATWPKGAMLDIIEWDTHKPLGQIPQVEQTYSVVGNMNEHQVAITESTFGGRPELVDTTGIMDYGSLIYVTLQRSKTAREAIRIMTDLVKDYSYYSRWGKRSLLLIRTKLG